MSVEQPMDPKVMTAEGVLWGKEISKGERKGSRTSFAGRRSNVVNRDSGCPKEETTTKRKETMTTQKNTT